MPRKRDGPSIAGNDQGPRQGGYQRPSPLPRAKSPRNPPGRPPSSHRRSRRRQPHPTGWREFSVRVVTKPGAEGAAALYAYLRVMARRFGLEVADVIEVRDRGEES